MAWGHLLAARARRRGDPAARFVLVLVASYANEDGLAWPTVDTLAADSGYHANTVRRALRQLAAARALTVSRTGRSSRYRLRDRASGSNRVNLTRDQSEPDARSIEIQHGYVKKRAAAAPLEPTSLYRRLPNWTAERLKREQDHQLTMEV